MTKSSDLDFFSCTSLAQWLNCNASDAVSCIPCMNKCINLHFSERERNVLFNDTLNTFYLQLYGVRHMVKDHSDSEKGNPLPPHRLLLSINSKGSFICTIPDRITHTTAFVTPVVEHWLEREIAQWVHPMRDQSDDPSHHEQILYLWATSRSLRFSLHRCYTNQD